MVRARFLYVLSLLLLAPAAVVAAAGRRPADGLLVMAHGGSEVWNATVREAVAAVPFAGPVEIAFGMADACTLRDAAARLVERGARTVAVVRLFVSGDSFRERTEKILGLAPGAPPAGADACPAPETGAHHHSMALFRVEAPLRFVLSQEGLADGRETEAILVDRARALSEAPAREDVVVLAHGPGDDAENERWIAAIGTRAQAIRRALPFHDVVVKTLREDWPEKRRVAEADLRDTLSRNAAEGRTTIVIPFRVEGFGPYAEVLEGLPYVADGRGLLPHPNVGQWIARQASAAAVELAAGPGLADRITVTATANPHALAEVAGGVSVVDRSEIETLQMQDVRDVVTFEPGVYVQGNVGRLGLGGFVVRGVGGNRVQTQVDGIPTAEEFSFGPLAAPRTAIDVDALQSVEIVRGPVSSLYGSDALGGVVSFVTRDPADYLQGRPQAFGARLAYDGASRQTLGALNAGIAMGAFEASVAVHDALGEEPSSQGTRATPDPMRTAANPQDRNAGGVLAKLTVAPSERLDLRFAVEGTRTRTTTEAFSLRAPVSGIPTLDHDAVDRARRGRLSATLLEQAGSAFADTVTGRLFLQTARTEQDTVELRRRATGNTERRSAFDFEQRTAGADLELRKGLGAQGTQLFTYGASYSDKRFDQLRQQREVSLVTGATLPSALPYPTKYFPESTVRQLGAFVQDDSDLLGGRLRVIAGLRYDRSELRPERDDAVFHSGNPGTPAPSAATSDALSPKLGIVLALGKQLAVTAQAAHGFRAPPYSDVNQGFTNLAFGYTALPNPNLKPETTDTYELGLRGRHARIGWSVNAFASRYDDFIEFAALGVNPTTGLLEYQSRNVTAARIRGLELQADGTVGAAWRWRLAAASIRGDDRTLDVPLNSIAPASLTAGLFWTPAGRLDAAVVARHAFAKSASRIDRRVVDQYATPAATRVELSLGLAIGAGFDLRLGVDNLFDEKIWEWGDVQGVTGTSAVLDRYTSPGRSLVATLRWSR